ncbi:MAG TPA: UPF0262 family protein [Alphaproteobacteria bacterium]|nr:UPF0262 family protein [Alphaproteobacteria bacterium]
MAESSNLRIADVVLDETSIVRWNPDIDHERRVAIFDLLEENHFAPKSGIEGPFRLGLRMEETRLAMDIKAMDGALLETIRLPLVPFRRIIKEYFVVCESYNQAIKTASRAQIEAIDMGRRGLHNDGAALLHERLADKVEFDDNTARRLFTLICVLQIRG